MIVIAVLDNKSRVWDEWWKVKVLINVSANLFCSVVLWYPTVKKKVSDKLLATLLILQTGRR